MCATCELERKARIEREREREREREEKTDFPIAKDVHIENIFPMYFPIILKLKNKFCTSKYSHGVPPNNKLGILLLVFTWLRN